MHRLGIRYRGKNNYPVWFARDPGKATTKPIGDEEAAMLAGWLRAAVDAALEIGAGNLRTVTMGLLDSDDRSFYPIECVRLPDGSWRYTATTLITTKQTGGRA